MSRLICDLAVFDLRSKFAASSPPIEVFPSCKVTFPAMSSERHYAKTACAVKDQPRIGIVIAGRMFL